MGNLKTKKQRMQDKIIDCLQEEFYVTDGELTAAVLDPHWLTPREVAQPLQQKCGILMSPNREYKNWGEFLDVMSQAACRQRVKF